MRGLLDNLPLKVISVTLALLLWFVIGEKTSERGLSVPVELQNVPRDLELVGEPTNVVDVRVRASPSVIQRLTTGDVSARIDLSGVREGEHIVHLTSDEDVVRCEVRDHDAHLPEKSDPTPDDEGGRGLLFVDSLSSRWGADPISGDGKTVWFEVPLE